jgi:hypothetical protein
VKTPLKKQRESINATAPNQLNSLGPALISEFYLQISLVSKRHCLAGDGKSEEISKDVKAGSYHRTLSKRRINSWDQTSKLLKMAYEVGFFKAGSTFSDLSKIISVAMLIGIFLPVSKCTQDFKVNMLNDLNWFLDRGGSNDGLVTQISKFMGKKYYWLENYCLVYDDVRGSDKHWFNGYRVASLHRNGKCGIVFYRTKGVPVTQEISSAYKEVSKLIDDISCPPTVGWFFTYGAHAKDCYNKIEAKIDAAGIEWTGIFVISDTSPILHSKGTFSKPIASIAYVNKQETRWGYNTQVWLTTARIYILLK